MQANRQLSRHFASAVLTLLAVMNNSQLAQSSSNTRYINRPGRDGYLITIIIQSALVWSSHDKDVVMILTECRQKWPHNGWGVICNHHEQVNVKQLNEAAENHR